MPPSPVLELHTPTYVFCSPERPQVLANFSVCTASEQVEDARDANKSPLSGPHNHDKSASDKTPAIA